MKPQDRPFLIHLGRKIAVFLLVSTALSIFTYVTYGLYDVFDQTWIDNNIRTRGILGTEYFLVTGALLTACGFPRQVLAFLSGYAFGFVKGTFVSVLAAGLGCVIPLVLARVFARSYLREHMPNKINAIDKFLANDPITKTIIIRFLPIGNNLITNLVAGATRVKAPHFIVGSLIGYFPQMAIFALMGKGVVVLNLWKIALSIVLFAVSSGLSYMLYRRYRLSEVLAKNALPSMPSESHIPR